MIDCAKTENYFAEKQRMTRTKNGNRICKFDCRECPLSSKNNGTSENLPCTIFEMYYPEKAISAIQKWSDEHPQRTYLSEFLKNYPNALLDGGIPQGLCPYHLGLMNREDCRKKCRNCIECWKQPIENGEESK